MAEPSESRVAVYIDFDNIVISRYDEVFGRGKFMSDKARSVGASEGRREASHRPAPAARAVVDVGAILDYATSFGSVVISRAFADWSAPANSRYSRQLVDRAVDLTQLFPDRGLPEERRGHPAVGGCRRGHVPAAGDHARRDRRRRLRLHPAGAALQATRPLRRRNRRRRSHEQTARRGLQRVQVLRRAARSRARRCNDARAGAATRTEAGGAQQAGEQTAGGTGAGAGGSEALRVATAGARHATGPRQERRGVAAASAPSRTR